MPNNVLLFKGNKRQRDLRDVVDSQIGAKLRELRNSKCWSQEALGKKLGVSAFQIQKYEMGLNHIRHRTLSNIAILFGVHVAYFFGAAGSSEPVSYEGGAEDETQGGTNRADS